MTSLIRKGMRLTYKENTDQQNIYHETDCPPRYSDQIEIGRHFLSLRDSRGKRDGFASGRKMISTSVEDNLLNPSRARC